MADVWCVLMAGPVEQPEHMRDRRSAAWEGERHTHTHTLDLKIRSRRHCVNLCVFAICRRALRNERRREKHAKAATRPSTSPNANTTASTAARYVCHDSHGETGLTRRTVCPDVCRVCLQAVCGKCSKVSESKNIRLCKQCFDLLQGAEGTAGGGTEPKKKIEVRSHWCLHCTQLMIYFSF